MTIDKACLTVALVMFLTGIVAFVYSQLIGGAILIVLLELAILYDFGVGRRI